MELSRFNRHRVQNVKRTLFCTLIVLVLAGFCFGQVGTPDQTAKTFYKWYMHELNAERNPTDEKAKLRQFVSARLAKWLGSKAYEDYGADYFIDAQDWGRDWENNIQISKVVVTGNSATLRIKLIQPRSGPTPEMGDKILDLKLLKEAGAWKIDRVTGKN